MLGLHPCRQSGPEALGQGPGLVGPGGPIGGHDHRSQVAQVDLVDPGRGRVGPVVPFGRLELGGDALGQRDERIGFDGGEPFGSGLLVHPADGFPHPGHPASQDLFSQGALIVRQRLQGSPAMNPLRLEPLGAGRGGPLGAIPGPVSATGAIAIRGTLPVAVLAAVPVPALAAVSAFATAIPAVIAVSLLAAAVPAAVAVSVLVLTGSAIPTRVALALPRPLIPTGTPLALRTVVAFIARSIGLKATTALFGGELGRHQGADFTAQQLESLRLGAFRLGREDRDDVEAVEMDVSLNPENVAHRCGLGG